MKKAIHQTNALILFLAMICAAMIASAQTPQAIPYQAVARNVNGNLIANQNISLRFSIVDQYIVPMTYYQETQTVTTNALGLFTANVGQGTPVINLFYDINWAGGFAKFLKVEMDVAGGTNYVNMGSTPLLSVPYSLYSAKSGNGMTDGSAFGSTMYWNGAVWDNNTNLYNAGQNIGIGTTTPSTKLEVVGTTTTTNLAVTSGASAGYVLQSDASGNASWTNPATIIGPETDPQVNSATTNKVPKWNGTTLTDGTIYDNGKVGIGTTNPLTKLHVDGQVTIVDGNQQEGKVLTSDANGTGRWVSPGGGNCFTNWQTFTTPGNAIFVVPTGVTSIKVQLWAGGAGGCNIINGTREGGGAGGYAEGIFTVTPGASIPVVVGGGGAQNGGGSPSIFNNSVMYADGGYNNYGGEAFGGYLNITGNNGGLQGISGTFSVGSNGINGGNGGLGLHAGGGGGGAGGGSGLTDDNDIGGPRQNGKNGMGSGGGGGGITSVFWGRGGDGQIIIFW